LMVRDTLKGMYPRFALGTISGNVNPSKLGKNDRSLLELQRGVKKRDEHFLERVGSCFRISMNTDWIYADLIMGPLFCYQRQKKPM